ncbi:MAG: aminomethyl-transferring glycine dehydrogenase subunit GcvPA [Candidatus Geothermarchaeota archaeon]
MSSLEEINKMMEYIGISSIDEIFGNTIPSEFFLKQPLSIPRFQEREVVQYIKGELAKNLYFDPRNVYAGGGVWPIYVPSAVKSIICRSEFLTSYTPYQAEISQGVLQALYEYQSLMAELLDMDVVNSSMYDWSSAAAEALLMACRVTKRSSVLIPKGMYYNRKSVINTYMWGANVKVIEYPFDEHGNIDLTYLRSVLTYEKIAGIYIEYPNSYGYICENIEDVVSLVHATGGLVVFGTDPLALPLLKPPGELDADIVVGEGQPLGNPIFFGGPLLGIFATKGDIKLIREMPGRIIGLTKTIDGETAYTMILQTREQHIRREKATSNICTNEALTAIASAVYISLLGKTGLINLSKRLLINSHKLYDILTQFGFQGAFNLPFFREFSLKINSPYDNVKIRRSLIERGILFGIIVNPFHVISVNEFHDENAFNYLLSQLKEVIQQ